jgi:hypothetical protein
VVHRRSRQLDLGLVVRQLVGRDVDKCFCIILDNEKSRKFADVVKEIRKLREKGQTVPQIAEQLMMSYTVVNQVVLRSYKMVARTEEVFERQEQMRLADG